MNEAINPYEPGAGTRPPALTGRDGLIRAVEIMLERIQKGRSAKGVLLVGLRGVGKTVLLNYVQKIARESWNCHTVFIEAPENKRLPNLLFPPLQRLLQELSWSAHAKEKVKKALRVLKNFAHGFKLKIGDFELTTDAFDSQEGGHSDLETDLPTLLVAIGEAAAEGQTMVVLLIDEMQYLTELELSAIIMAMHQIAQNQLPLILVGAGLPQLVGLAGKSKSYAERLFDFPELDPLDHVSATKALMDPAEQEGATFEPEAVEEIIRITEGYPYFLQEWGYQAWNLAEKSPIDLPTIKIATTESIQRLDESFFRVRFDRLTPREKE